VLVFAALWLIVRKRAQREGAVTLWYLLLFSIGQFVLEFLLQSTETVFWVIRVSQLVYGVLAVAALLLLVSRSGEKSAPADGETAAAAEAGETADSDSGPKEESNPAPEEPAKAEETPAPSDETPKEA